MARGRILIGKPGLDGHDRGRKVHRPRSASSGLRSHLHRHPPQPRANRGYGNQENVDAIGLSVMSGAHKVQFKRVIDLLKERGAERHSGLRRRTDSSRRLSLSDRDRRESDLHARRHVLRSILGGIQRMLLRTDPKRLTPNDPPANSRRCRSVVTTARSKTPSSTFPERSKSFTTASGLPVERLYLPDQDSSIATTTGSDSPAASLSLAAPIPPCTAAGSGPCGNMRDTRPPRNRTGAIAICSRRDRPA